ncbi:MAG TPA: hypothetical protein VLJ42_12080 [Solirubrobacteraceae bacterium]|nr:hypothetical protein [Solirubrobacteraceae bacterium]
MRFVDFLKTTVLLSAGAATALATVTVLSAGASSDTFLVLVAVSWWVIATMIGLALGRRAEANPPITRLLASAKATNVLPEHRPSTILLNRLWPLLLFTLLAGALAFLAPQIPGIGAGFAIIWALAWRRQNGAVAAIEERDGVRFYILRTSPVHPIALQRAPGFKALHAQRMNGAPT